MYITVEFSGGMGNQLFQYHTAVYLSKHWNREFVYTNPQLGRVLIHGGLKINSLCDHKTINIKKVRYITQPRGKWKKWILDHPIPHEEVVCLRGWFQTFWDETIDIPLDFRLNVDYDYAFIHFRNHSKPPSNAPHHDVDLWSYYEKCINSFNNGTKFVILGDDEEGCIKLSKISGGVVVTEPDPMRALSIMKHAALGGISSNSTFSLWGGYFSHKLYNNKTFAPSQMMKLKSAHDRFVGDEIYDCGWIVTRNI